MVSFSASIRMSPIGIVLLIVVSTSVIFYFHDMIKESRPIKKLSAFASLLKSQGYHVVGFQVDEISLKQLLIASIEVAERGGFEVKRIRESNNLKESSKGKTDEGVNDPLTEGDIMSHRIMYNSFKITWPTLKIISEEKDSTVPEDLSPITLIASDEKVNKIQNGKKVSSNDVVVWIDPLDATKEYSEDLREYVTTMVCVAVKGQPVIGVIHKPFTGKTYWAWNEHGNNIESSKKSSKNRENEKAPVIIVSRSHAGNVNQTARKAFGEEAEVIAAGGAGYKVLSLVSGRADVYLHSTKIKKWDICAGNAILNSINGKMSDLYGHTITYKGVSGDDVVLKNGLIATVVEHGKFLKKLGRL